MERADPTSSSHRLMRLMRLPLLASQRWNRPEVSHLARGVGPPTVARRRSWGEDRARCRPSAYGRRPSLCPLAPLGCRTRLTESRRLEWCPPRLTPRKRDVDVVIGNAHTNFAIKTFHRTSSESVRIRHRCSSDSGSATAFLLGFLPKRRACPRGAFHHACDPGCSCDRCPSLLIS
jgi:hypothetical protein